MTFLLFFLSAVSGDTPSADINCFVRYQDCTREIAMVENGIRNDPQLAELRRQADQKLASLGDGMTKGAARALAEDEARYRRSLRRDLFTGPSHAMLGEDERANLRLRLSRRLDWLQRVRTGADSLPGKWANASGEIVITQIAPDRFAVSADLAELDFLKWTCELDGSGVMRGRRLVADMGDAEQLVLRLRHGTLHTAHIFDQSSSSCGANGHANGVWFKIDRLAGKRDGK